MLGKQPHVSDRHQRPSTHTSRKSIWPSFPRPSAYVPTLQGKDGESCFLALWGKNGGKKERTVRNESLPTDWLFLPNRLYSMKKHLPGKIGVCGFVRVKEELSKTGADYQRKGAPGTGT